MGVSHREKHILKRQRPLSQATAATLPLVFLLAAQAQGDEQRLPFSPGEEALEMARASGAEAQSFAELFFVDALFTNKGTDTEQLDQRAGATLTVKAASTPGQRIGARGGAHAKAWTRKKIDSEDTSSKLEEKALEGTGYLSGVVSTDGGIEVFGGVEGVYLPKTLRKKSLSSGTLTTTLAKTNVFTYHLGVLKRSGQTWSAGAWMRLSAEAKRSYERPLSPTPQGEESVFLPGILAGFAQFAVTSGLNLGLEFALVSASGGSEKAEDGNPVLRDSYRVHARLDWAMTNQTALGVGIRHSTLSYNDQGYMNFDNIPATTAEILLSSGGGGSGGGLKLFGGVHFTLAEDSQTTPELNAKYSLYAYALRVGCGMPM